MVRAIVPRFLFRFSLTVALFAAVSSPACGQPIYYWNGNNPSANPANGGFGTWDSTTANWRSPTVTSDPPVTWSDGGIAVFAGSTGSLVTLAAPFMASEVDFNSSVYTLTNSNSANTLTVPTIVVSPGVFGECGKAGGNPVLAGSAGLAVSGGDQLVLGGAVGFTGGVTVTGGSTVSLGDRFNLNFPSPYGFLLPNGTGTPANPVALNGGNLQVTYFGGSALVFTSPTNALGQLTVSGTSQLQLTAFNSSGGGGAAAAVFTTDGKQFSNGQITPANATPLVLNAGSQLTLACYTGGTNPSQTNGAVFGATTLLGNATFAFTASGGATPGQQLLALGGYNFSTPPNLIVAGAVKDNGFTMTVLGGGTSTVPGATLAILGVQTGTGANSLTGPLVIGSLDGTQGAAVSVANGAASMTSGNITVNPFSQLFLAGSTTYGVAGQTVTLNGVGNQTLAQAASGTFSALAGALREGGISGSYPATLASNLVLATDSVIGVAAPSGPQSTGLTLTGNLSGSGMLQKQGSAALIVAGTGNTATGGTTLNVGEITVNAGSSLGTGPLNLASLGAESIVLTLNNTAQTVGGLASSFSVTSGTLIQRLTLNRTALTINQAANSSFGVGAVSTLTSPITGTGSVTLSALSTGTLSLTGANSYTGGTTVNGGTLLLNNGTTGSAVGTGPLTVAAGGTLGGAGSAVPAAGNAVTINGMIAPGNSAGTLTFGSSTTPTIVTLHGTYVAETTNTPADASDLIAVSGNLVLDSSTSVLDLPLANTYDPAGTIYTIATYTGTLTGIFHEVDGLPSDYQLSYGNGSNSAITLAPVPEPGTLLLTALAAVGAAGWYRRRN